jgi:hypothetical protein
MTAATTPARIGRPPKAPEHRRKGVPISMTPATHLELQRKAHDAGCTMSEFVRRALSAFDASRKHDALLGAVEAEAGSGARAIVAECLRQRKAGDVVTGDPLDCAQGEIATAAACYAVTGDRRGGSSRGVLEQRRHPTGFTFEDAWPWPEALDRRKRHPPAKRLAIAGSLVAAELARLEQQRRGDRKSAGS